MPYYKDEGTREEFMVIETAEKILDKREKEKKEQDEGKTKAERFVKALWQFQNRKELKRTVLVFESGDQLILDLNVDKSMAIFYRGKDMERNREVIADEDWELLLGISKKEVVAIK